MKKLFFTVLRWAIPLAIVGWLVTDAARNDSFARLRDEPKHWGLLTVAAAFCFLAVSITFVRWFLLVRALDIPFRLRDAFRLGFFGYLLNFVSLGSVGGDVFKAVFLAREKPGRRPEAAVTVLVDRLLGLYGLLLVATAAILLTGLWRETASPEMRWTCEMMFWLTAASMAIFAFSFTPWATRGPLLAWLLSRKRLGPIVERLVWANHMYIRRWWVILLATVLSIMVHCSWSAGLWFIGRGLLSQPPTLADHLVIVPIGMATGALPLPLNGLGAFEYVVDYLYQHVPRGLAIPPSSGLLVALAYRAVTIVIALVGAVVYACSRREISETLHEAEAVKETDMLGVET